LSNRNGNDMEADRRFDDERWFILKRSPQFVGLLGVLAILAPLAWRRKHRYPAKAALEPGHDGIAGRSQEPESQVDMGSVVVRGGATSGIDYTFHMRSHGVVGGRCAAPVPSYKVTLMLRETRRGWWGSGRAHSMHMGSARMTIRWVRSTNFSGEFVINVPRDTDW
jgi:hypothetical protein